jgi:hypothetical protein
MYFQNKRATMIKRFHQCKKLTCICKQASHLVVEFTIDSSVAVVPSSWMIGVNHCQYPTASKGADVCRLVKKASAPEKNWDRFKVVIIKGFGKLCFIII